MGNQFVCAYFKSDKSFSVIPKNRCALRGAFEVGEEVRVTWRGQGGSKQVYIGKIIKIANKGKGNLELLSLKINCFNHCLNNFLVSSLSNHVLTILSVCFGCDCNDVSVFCTEEKKVLDKFEGYCGQTMNKRQEEGCSEEVVLNELCQASLENFASENVANEEEGSDQKEV